MPPGQVGPSGFGTESKPGPMSSLGMVTMASSNRSATRLPAHTRHARRTNGEYTPQTR